jgi:hypothetical protein
MSWFWKSVKGIVDPRASGESIIERCEVNYREFERTNAGAEPHQILAIVYSSRMMTHGKNPNSEIMQAEGLAKTFEYSCLPFPTNVRALAIALVNFERPDILKQCPDMERQYSEYMRPVREARQRNQCDELYRKYNPKMAALMDAK